MWKSIIGGGSAAGASEDIELQENPVHSTPPKHDLQLVRQHYSPISALPRTRSTDDVREGIERRTILPAREKEQALLRETEGRIAGPAGLRRLSQAKPWLRDIHTITTKADQREFEECFVKHVGTGDGTRKRQRFERLLSAVEARRQFHEQSDSRLAGIPLHDLVALLAYCATDHDLINDLLHELAAKWDSTDLEDQLAVKEATARLELLRPYMKSLCSVIQRLPPGAPNVVYRGISPKENSKKFLTCPIGSAISLDYFVSTSAKRERSFSREVLLIIRPRQDGSSRGKNVWMFSSFPLEREFLIPPGCEFEVLSRAQTPNGDRHEWELELAEL